MTVKECIAQNGWNVNSNGHVGKYWNVDIGFINSENDREDETEFSITAYDENDLSELFTEFCKENKIEENIVLYVSVVEMADNEEDLS